MSQARPSGRVELKTTQRRVLAALEAEGSLHVTRKRYEELAGVSRSQAAYDLAELVEVGVLERLGEGRASRYRIARRSAAPRRRWTNDRIRAGLEEFCSGREEWPSAREFKAAGHADLYVAASRYGGIGHWAVELGFGRPARVALPEPVPLRRVRPARLRLLLAAALIAVVVAATGGALKTLRHVTAAPTAAPQTSADAAPATLARPTPKARASTKVARPTGAAATRPKRTVRRSHPSTPAATSEPTAQLASATSAAPERSTAVSSTATVTRTTASSGGPRPLPPPSTGGPPQPLPPPG